MRDDDTTHFGFSRIPVAEKARKVAEVFNSVTDRYDLMNDLMSLGTHRIMKQITVEMATVREGYRVLDLASGTGDLAARLAPAVGDRGQVIMSDINASMLEAGRDRMLDRGLVLDCVQADAESLPFADDTFHCVTMAFGLRNVTDKSKALRAIWRTLRPRGQLVVLEFSKPRHLPVQHAYSLFKRAWPRLGEWVADDADSYRYLVESIDMHPDQETLEAMFRDAGFVRVRHHDLLDGVAAVHVGQKS